MCNFGWTIESAALACQQMGWVLNTEDYDIPPIDMPQAGIGDPILLSNVRCGPLDTDLTKCKRAEGTDMFLNSCSHLDDVGLRWVSLNLVRFKFHICFPFGHFSPKLIFLVVNFISIV